MNIRSAVLVSVLIVAVPAAGSDLNPDVQAHLGLRRSFRPVVSPQRGDAVFVTAAESSSLFDGLRVIGTVELGTKCRVMEVSNIWILVRDDSQNLSGWISSLDVAPAEQAIQRFSQVIRERPTAAAYIGRARAFQLVEQYSSALADCSEAIKQNPWSVDAHLIRGDVLCDLGQRQEAITVYSEAIRLNPRSAAGYMNRGVTFGEIGDLVRGLEDLNQALDLAPQSAVGFNNRGVLRHMQGDAARALLDYNEALRLNPGYGLCLANRGGIHVDTGELEKARLDLDEAIRIAPQTFQAHYNRARLWIALKDLDRAVVDFDEALRLKPRSAQTLAERARLQLNRNAIELALADYQALVRLEPRNAGAHAAVGMILSMSPRRELRDGFKAIHHARLACDLVNSKELRFKEVLAAAYAEAGQFELAIVCQESVLESESDEGYRNIAEARLAVYRTQRSLDSWDAPEPTIQAANSLR